MTMPLLDYLRNLLVEITYVHVYIQTIETRRKIVTLSDGNATVEVKLWASLGIFEGSIVEISCGPVPA